jgi:hypothetical protein
MKPEIFVTLHAPMLEEELHDDAAWIPSLATVVLRHSSGDVGFQIDRDARLAFASFAGNCVLVERSNSPRWRLALRSELTNADCEYYSLGLFVCTEPKAELIEQLRAADKNVTLARQNAILSRHGKPSVRLSSTIFENWHTEPRRVRTSALRFLLERCSAASLWRHAEFGTYARFIANDEQTALRHVRSACDAAGLRLTEVQYQRELPAW